MPFEEFEDVEAIDNERRKAVAKSIRIALKNSRGLGKRSSIRLIDPGGKLSFDWSRKIPAGLFTTRTRAKASLFFIAATLIKVCGICPGAA